MRNKKRQIVLDTETTGLEWSKGNRIVEIGAVELLDRRLSGDKFHRYLKPDVSFESGAQEVTGLTMEFLADKPEFSMIADEFLAYINGAELIIHNAAFDLGFLDYELSRLGSQYGKITDRASVLDTLVMARERYPVSVIHWMHYVSVLVWITPTVSYMVHYLTRRYWPMFISR